MKIIIGSKNPTKIQAVAEVFPEAMVVPLDVKSGVSAQPFSDEETKRGAINRAKRCMESTPGSFGFGLEGGVMYIENQLYLCNWGALVTPDGQILTGSGARIVLPWGVETGLKDGTELGDLMDAYARKQEVRKNEGAIGVFTNNLISRKEMFAHVVKLLRGQWEYWT